MARMYIRSALALAVALSGGALPPAVESAQMKRCNGVFQGKGQRKANKANRWR